MSRPGKQDEHAHRPVRGSKAAQVTPSRPAVPAGGGCRCARGGLSVRQEPRTPGAPCPDEERLRQAGLLARGSVHSDRLLRTVWSQWHSGRIARRLQLQGQPGFYTPFPFDPLPGNLSQRDTYRGTTSAASPKCCQSLGSRLAHDCATGAREGLIGKSGRRETA